MDGGDMVGEESGGGGGVEIRVDRTRGREMVVAL